LFNPFGFDPYNYSLKIQKPIGTPNSQSGSSLGSVKVHCLTFSFTLGLPLGPQPCKPFLGREPKARVATIFIKKMIFKVELVFIVSFVFSHH